MADRRVYVGRFDYQTSERDIEKFLRGYGKLVEVMMKNGFAFVEFADARDADDAVHDLNGKDFNGYRVVVDIARGTPHGRDWSRDREKGYYGGGGWGNNRTSRYGGFRAETRAERTDYRLIVENLSSRVSWQELKDTFRQIAEVTYATAHNKVKNEGILEFATRNDMKKAIKEMDGRDMNGRKIRLVEEKRRKAKSPSRSRSRSTRSRTLSKSRSRSKSPEPSKVKKKRSSLGRKKSHSRSRSTSRTAGDRDRGEENGK